MEAAGVESAALPLILLRFYLHILVSYWFYVYCFSTALFRELNRRPFLPHKPLSDGKNRLTSGNCSGYLQNISKKQDQLNVDTWITAVPPFLYQVYPPCPYWLIESHLHRITPLGSISGMRWGWVIRTGCYGSGNFCPFIMEFIVQISFIKIPLTSLSSIPKYRMVTQGEEWLNLLHKSSQLIPYFVRWMYPKVFRSVCVP